MYRNHIFRYKNAFWYTVECWMILNLPQYSWIFRQSRLLCQSRLDPFGYFDFITATRKTDNRITVLYRKSCANKSPTIRVALWEIGQWNAYAILENSIVVLYIGIIDTVGYVIANMIKNKINAITEIYLDEFMKTGIFEKYACIL